MSGCYIFHFIQLVYINSIGTIFTRSHIDNSLISCIDMRLGDGWPILDGEARVIDGRIAYHDRSALGQVDILSQLDFQLAAYVINANVLVCQLLCISSTDDIELFIQLLTNNFLVICLAIITCKFQPIIQSSHFVLIIDNAGHRGTIFTIQSWSSIFGFHCQRSARCPISTFRAGQTDGSILAVDDDRRAVFPIDANSTIFAVSTFFADSNIITKFYIVIISMGIRILGPCQDKIPTFDFLTIFLSFLTTNTDCSMSIGHLFLDSFQLCNIDCIGIERACRHASKLAGDRVVITDGNSIGRRFPSRTMGIPLRIGCLFSLNSQITVSCTRSHRTTPQCNAVSQVSLCSIADSGGILCQFCYCATQSCQ